MIRFIQITLYCFLFITIATASVVLYALIDMWFLQTTPKDYPYLSGFLVSLIGEVIAVVIGIAKIGSKYFPKVLVNKDEDSTLKFMNDFLGSAGQVTIVSNRASWLTTSPAVVATLRALLKKRVRIEVFTTVEVVDQARSELEELGIEFYATQDSNIPEARFTLINGDRAGAARLAIASGSHPDHEITIFTNRSGPQIIAMAKDSIRSLRKARDE